MCVGLVGNTYPEKLESVGLRLTTSLAKHNDGSTTPNCHHYWYLNSKYEKCLCRVHRLDQVPFFSLAKLPPLPSDQMKHDNFLSIEPAIYKSHKRAILLVKGVRKFYLSFFQPPPFLAGLLVKNATNMIALYPYNNTTIGFLT